MRYIVERAFGTLKEVHGVARASYTGAVKVQEAGVEVGAPCEE